MTKQWVTNTSADWTTAADWTGGVPGAADDVQILQGTPLVTSNIGTVNSLLVSTTATPTTGNLTFTGGTAAVTNFVEVDSGCALSLDTTTGTGGSQLTVGGLLSIGAGAGISVGNDSLSASTTVTVGTLSSTGFISLTDHTPDGGQTQASLLVGAAAGFGTAGVVTGRVILDGNTLLQFGSGGLTSIDAGGIVLLAGPNARIAIAGQAGNSALTTLKTNNGFLSLNGGASLTTVAGTDLTNTDTISVDDFSFAEGGSFLAVGGTLNNNGAGAQVNIGRSGPTAPFVSAAALVNSGAIGVNGNTFGLNAQAALLIAGGGTNTGTIGLNGNALFKVGANFADTGSLNLSGSTIEIAGGTFTETGTLGGAGGRFLVDPGARLEIGGAEALFPDFLQFNGPGGTLKFDTGFNYNMEIQGYGRNDTVDVAAGVASALVLSASRTNTHLDVLAGNTVLTTLYLRGAFTGYVGTADGSGGTNVTGIEKTYTLLSSTEIVGLFGTANTVSATAATLNASDSLTGYSATDTLALSGGGTFALGALTAFTGFERVTVAAGQNYAISTGDANVAAGATMTIDASKLGSGNTLNFDGSAETNGRFVVTGGAGADTITTGAGADTINGHGGIDTMTGGAGNDIYYVDNAGDKVIEAVGGGTDTVYASVSYTLATGQEIETLRTSDGTTGTSALKLTGNAFANTILGNAANNVIDGGAGVDRMSGYAGDDTYYVDNAADAVLESANNGTDTVNTSVSYTLTNGQAIEILQTTDKSTGTSAINLTGNALANSILGNASANTLDGGAGNDTLTGFGGSDTFLFDTALNASTNLDHIADFASSTSSSPDVIALSHALFSALTVGPVASSAFTNATASSGFAGETASSRILYDSTSGGLYYDANGSAAGGPVEFAILDNKAPLTATDFKVV